MLRDITLGQYFPAESVIHRLDPRVKIMLTLAYIVVIFLIRNFVGYGVLFVATAFIVWLSKVPPKFMLKGLRPLLFFILLTAILNLFMTDGHEIFRLGFIRITYEGIIGAAFMVLRITFLIVASSLLTLTTTPIRLTDGLERLLNPFKKIGLPAHELAMMMTIALRFIPTLLEETDKIMKAQSARGSDFESRNVLRRAKAMIPILVPLFISAFRRADELATAMECRCYRGGEGRTRLNALKMTELDMHAIMFMILFVVLIVGANRVTWEIIWPIFY
ncbi:MAG: energy-coupling factor transporter transmembrane protein EcfT [Oscillospiraceae bacterium]|nr:energy-coupling factor transporter transmembrane protein EcfT [Oscillospiraceae bacterium]